MKLIFQKSPCVTIATNSFINVPVILKYETAPLIEIVKEQALGFTTQVQIYHADGTYLAKVKGNRPYPTEEGKKAKIVVRDLEGKFVCSLGNRVLFELTHGVEEAFTASAELYAPDGCFLKCSENSPVQLSLPGGQAIRVGGVILSGCVIQDTAVGIWVKRDGSVAIGASG